MTMFSKLLKRSNELSNEVCDNPTKNNCKELQRVTEMAIEVLQSEIEKRRCKEKTKHFITDETNDKH